MQKIIKHSNVPNKSIVFIHGFPFDHHMWKHQINYFKSDYTCISYDIRGLGRSSAGDGLFTMEDLVDDLFNVILETRIEKPVICGLSLGGYIALRAVEKKENIFKGLIICDTKSEADNDAAKLKRAAGVRFIKGRGSREFCEAFVPECFGDNSIKRLGKEYLEILDRSLKSVPRGLKGCLLAMAGRTDTSAYLSHINLPTLLLCGEDDNFSPPHLMKKMAGKIKHAEFYLIKNAGHMTAIENPENVNLYIDNYLKKLFK